MEGPGQDGASSTEKEIFRLTAEVVAVLNDLGWLEVSQMVHYGWVKGERDVTTFSCACYSSLWYLWPLLGHHHEQCVPYGKGVTFL